MYGTSRWTGPGHVGALLGLSLGCNSLDAPPDGDTSFRTVPLDDRPVQRAAMPPPPVSGGTLHVLSNGSAVVVADADRDTVSIVDLTQMSVVATVTLETGDEPGRIAEDASGRVHVALRGGGAIASIDPVSGSLLARHEVCLAPRGLAFDAPSNVLRVACAEGTVAALDPDSGDVSQTAALGPDLRDVIVRSGEIWVTRLKSAEIVRLNTDGAVVGTTALPAASGEAVSSEGATRTIALRPNVAWRAIATNDGGAMVVHQEAVDEEVELTEPTETGSAYGGGSSFNGCGSIVRNAVSVVGPDGSAASPRLLDAAPLPVDVAASPDGVWIAIASAGLADPDAPRPTVEFRSEGASASGSSPDVADFASSGVTLFPASGAGGQCEFGSPQMPTGPAVSVAFALDGRLIAQTREPSLLLWDPNNMGEPTVIELPGDSVADTGHDLFHRDTGAGLACASCHPGGAEDGHVWEFSGFGERRTQALHVGLEGTAPFHWSGDLNDVGALMTEVFVERMGGARQSDERVGVLTEWLFALQPPAPIRSSDDAAVARGDQLFHASSVGCSGCHAGGRLTNNESVSVGTLPNQGRLQVPSLVGVGYRAPFMHDGCAATLTDRFDPTCGGSEHGNTSGLDEGAIGDLVAYLESL